MKYFRDTVPLEVGISDESVLEPASDRVRRIIPVVDLTLGIRLGLDTLVPGADRWSVEVAPHVNQLGFGARAGAMYCFGLPF